MVKIVTYNVNGLRPRVAQHGSLRRLLDALDADIICFQETKLSRQDLSADVIMAEGYEAFVSCNRTWKGRGAYSGVATFCRVTTAFSSQEVALPVAAEEGFTGLQDYAKNSEILGDFVLAMPVEEEGLGEITREDLLSVDNEGRCIITDHRHFVLFNIYGPAVEEDDKERVRFKLLFYKILQKRWEHLLALGKRVFVVGDLNIAPASIDKCDAPPGFEKQMFREWLRSMLKEHGGPFFDAFRSKHPERTGAYTCFNQKVGAEEYNYGSRIDHILISGACLHHCYSVEDHSIYYCHVEECEIMNHFKRGNSEKLSKWKGGRSSKLEGSDHIPVYILLKEIPELPVHNIPPSAARYLPEVRGRQSTIVSFLKKGKTYEPQDATNLNLSEDRVDDSCCSDGLENKTIAKEELAASITECSKGGNLPSLICKGTNLDQWINGGSSGVSHNSKKASFSSTKSVPNKKIKRNLSSQPTIKSFFQQPGSKTGNASTSTLVTPVETVHYMNETCVPNDDSLPENMQCTISAAEDQGNTNTSCSLSTDKCNAATLEWQRIQQKMKMTLPCCKGHREPCIPRSVKKGSNIGRLFYVCARAQGPASNPEANCGHFQWAPVKSKEKCL
ncbi:DNA-(apurinic or apyrimidinic site) endonuclease 2-like [Phragmites australis]|uniref:DNA-(apurinic or apyrimidinic site) endonuclease 2-like n=1 Tax=Phragmites australis TaxID=29695 RepID=UPI002D78BB3B|nr:DNA-(apurinic or apyrimidinic site) endonuclease 2-like [Phragmites australis]XP_062194375.1 DNA-(apurinic or apyrimidinic site) endonuclease 2-like [Phragmites australis]